MSDSGESSTWTKRLAAPLLAVLAVICCLAAPLIVAALGSVAIGSFAGWIVAAIAFAAACFFLLRRRTRRC